MTTNYIPTAQKLIAYVQALEPSAQVEVSVAERGEAEIDAMNGTVQSFQQSTAMTSVSLRVVLGKKEASGSSDDLSDQALQDLAKSTVTFARIMPDDPDLVVTGKSLFVTDVDDRIGKLDLTDTAKPLGVNELRDMTLALCAAAQKVPNVVLVEASASCSYSTRAHVSSEGFAAQYGGTATQAVAVVTASNGDDQSQEYSYQTVRHIADLRDMADIGTEAANKAVAKLGAKSNKVAKGKYPVVFDRQVSRQLIGFMAQAINGANIAKGNSFLKDKMGQPIFPADVTIVDDPTMPRGLGSQAYDGDGLPSDKLVLVQNGTLKNWVLNLRYAKKLGLTPNGRGNGTTNLFMENGATGVDDLIADISYGVLVTGMLGHDSPLVTGDLSRGATGFLIENGRVTKPLKGITIAGNLLDMYRTLRVADDLDIKAGYSCPTLRVDSMAVA